MKIRILWAFDGEAYWSVSAWDEYTLDENPDGYAAELKNLQGAHGMDSVRALDVEIPERAVSNLFKVPAVIAMKAEEGRL